MDTSVDKRPVPVRMQDVAAVAGVSLKTVSRVINDEPSVRPEKRDRVLRAIERLGFQPNLVARSLATRRTRTLGLIVPDISNTFFAQGIDGCATTAEQHGYNLFLSAGGYSGAAAREARHIQALLAQQVAGIILWTSSLTEVRLLSILNQMKHSCPFVFIDCPFTEALQDAIPSASIRVAHREVGILATEHLLAEGRRRIAHIEVQVWSGRQQAEGYRETLLSHGIIPREQWTATVSRGTIEQGTAAAADLLAQRPRPDAIFAYNDLVAVGALLACRARRLRVPGDVAIVGMDDTELASLMSPPLTSIRLYQDQIGRHAVARLLELIHDNDRPALNPPLSTIDLPSPKLLVRASSALTDEAADA